jgi:hypothetical protein
VLVQAALEWALTRHRQHAAHSGDSDAVAAADAAVGFYCTAGHVGAMLMLCSVVVADSGDVVCACRCGAVAGSTGAMRSVDVRAPAFEQHAGAVLAALAMAVLLPQAPQRLSSRAQKNTSAEANAPSKHHRE